MTIGPPDHPTTHHFTGVIYDGGWKYDSNTAYHAFEPREPDTLVAAVAVAIAPASRYNKTMKTLAEIRHILQAQKPYLAERYGVVELGVFGSYVRGEQHPDSDLDVLIELERPPRISLIGLVELEYDLSEVLGLKVDVALKKNLRKRIGQRILSEVIPI